MASGQTQSTATATEEDVVFEVRDASITFSMERGQSKVLNDVDAEIYREETFAIVGESGCGKTMFASALMDAVKDPGYLTGELTYYPRDDDPVDVLSLDDEELQQLRWEEIAMVFQGGEDSFNPTMKIEDHFRETIEAHDGEMEERMSYARELLETLYLDAERVLDVYPHELSGGMQQRTLIALSLVLDPEVLIMDEPTGALDLLMQQSIINMLYRIKDEFDLTIVFITHDIPLIAGLADRLGVMYAFDFIEIGEVEDVLTDAAHPYARALVRTIPSIDTPTDEMAVIEGDSPDPVAIPTGCSYHPRCPLADELCEREEPDLLDVEEDHVARCHYWDQAREGIDYTLEDA